MSEEIKEEVKEEVVEDIDMLADCDGNCESCSQDCFGDFEFEPIHKKGSFANILSIGCKVLALAYFVLSLWIYIASIVEYTKEAGMLPMSVLEIIVSYIDQFGLLIVVFLGFGEVVNLINRIKESIMY